MAFPRLKIIQAAKTLPINTLYLFGSVARGTAGPISDVDFAYQASKKLSPEARFALKLKVRDSLSKVLQSDHLDVVDLEEAPPLLAHRILQGGKILYCFDAKQRVRLEFSRLVEYLDFADDLNFYVQATLGVGKKTRHG